MKDLGEWKLVTDEAPENVASPSTPTRRTRRGTSTPIEGSMTVVRETDGISLKKGDCILVNGEPKYISTNEDAYYAVVTDISTGIHQFLRVYVAPLVRPDVDGEIEEKTADLTDLAGDNPAASDVEEVDTKPPQLHRNELLLTAEINEIFLKDVIEKVQVLSTAQFGEVAMDASLEESVFLCCRATDRFRERISAPFDFSAWLALLNTNWQQAVEFVAEKTLIIVSPKKKTATATSIQDRLRRSAVHKNRKYTVVSGSDENLSDDLLSPSSDDDEEDEDDEDEENGGKRARTPRGHKRKPGRPPGSSKKRPREVVSPKKRFRDVAKDTDAFQKVVNVLSPHNRGFKVKTGSTLASLPSFSQSATKAMLEEGLSGSSEAFRELKEKLHTSTRVALLPCREEQFAYVYTALETAVQGKTGCCLYLSGTPGVGKTATVREAIGALRASVEQGYLDDFEYLEINCLNMLAPGAAYEKLYEHVSGIKVTAKNATVLLREHFERSTPDEGRKPLIVLVDELDQLITRNQQVMYNFFNWPKCEHSRLIVVAVANTMDLPERALSNKTASRLGLHRYAFRGYTEDELGIIIAHRLTLLSESNKRRVEISADAMRFASKKVALVSGDARRALAICRRAVEIAELDYLETIAQSNTPLTVPEDQQTYSVRIIHIGKAIAETVNSPVAQVLAALPFAAKLVLVGILLRIRRSGMGEIALGEAMDEMRNCLQLLTTKGSTHALRALSENENYMSLLYGDRRNLLSTHVRLHHVTQIVNELAEQGIIAQQNIRSDRHRLIRLVVAEDEITSVIKRDLDVATML